MSYSADNLDLSTLPASPLVTVDREAIIAARKALFADLWAQARVANPTLPAFDTLNLEYEPMTIANEGFANSEALILDAINGAGKKLRLKDAYGSFLDHPLTGPRVLRQTFILAPDQTIAWHYPEVSPNGHAQRVAYRLRLLQKQTH